MHTSSTIFSCVRSRSLSRHQMSRSRKLCAYLHMPDANRAQELFVSTQIEVRFFGHERSMSDQSNLVSVVAQMNHPLVRLPIVRSFRTERDIVQVLARYQVLIMIARAADIAEMTGVFNEEGLDGELGGTGRGLVLSDELHDVEFPVLFQRPQPHFFVAVRERAVILVSAVL